VETTFVFKIKVGISTKARIETMGMASFPTPTTPDDLVMPETMSETNSESTTESISEATTLDQIPKGESALVLAVIGEDPIARRLGDLGIRKGVQIEVLRRAPMGDPTVYELCSYQLCLRRSETARVRVRALPLSAPSHTESDRR